MAIIAQRKNNKKGQKEKNKATGINVLGRKKDNPSGITIKKLAYFNAPFLEKERDLKC